MVGPVGSLYWVHIEGLQNPERMPAVCLELYLGRCRDSGGRQGGR